MSRGPIVQGPTVRGSICLEPFKGESWKKTCNVGKGRGLGGCHNTEPEERRPGQEAALLLDCYLTD